MVVAGSCGNLPDYTQNWSSCNSFLKKVHFKHNWGLGRPSKEQRPELGIKAQVQTNNHMISSLSTVRSSP